MLLSKSKTEIYNILNSHLPNNINKQKTHGEVFTPIDIVETHLNQVPKSVWSNPNLKILEPANGVGNYPVIAYYKLMDGLKTKIPNKVARSKHIITKILYMCELDKSNVTVSKKIFGENANIVQCDFINERNKWESKFNVDGFDIIMGNPPFQSVSVRNEENRVGAKGIGNQLWPKFVDVGLELLNKNGYLVFLHPPQWRRPEKKLYKEMIANQLIFLQIFSKKTSKEVFGVQSRFDIYVLQNKPYTSKTTIIDQNLKKHTINLSKWPFIPNYLFGVFSKILLFSENEKKTKGLEVLFDSKNHTQHLNTKKDNRGANVSPKKTKKYTVPVVHSMTKKGLGFVYTKTHLSENNKKGKVILNFNEKLYPYNDYKGEYGMSQISFGLKIKNKSHGDKLIRGLNSQCFSEVVKATKWGAFQTDYRMFPYIKRDFFKMKLFKAGARTLKKASRKENKKTRKSKHRLKK